MQMPGSNFPDEKQGRPDRSWLQADEQLYPGNTALCQRAAITGHIYFQAAAEVFIFART
jgi:hypothetical protein